LTSYKGFSFIRTHVAFDTGGLLYAGMSVVPYCPEAKFSKKLVWFGPESLAWFAPESLAYFTPE
jgi:hypothetical protein